MFHHSILLSSLEEPAIAAILAQLENHELRQLARKHLAPNSPIDQREISTQLSRHLEFTLQTRINLVYDTY